MKRDEEFLKIGIVIGILGGILGNLISSMIFNIMGFDSASIYIKIITILVAVFLFYIFLRIVIKGSPLIKG